jgi:hypothetical protein
VLNRGLFGLRFPWRLGRGGRGGEGEVSAKDC